MGVVTITWQVPAPQPANISFGRVSFCLQGRGRAVIKVIRHSSLHGAVTDCFRGVKGDGNCGGPIGAQPWAPEPPAIGIQPKGQMISYARADKEKWEMEGASLIALYSSDGVAA